MEPMDDLHHRLAVLEQQTAALQRHSQVVERRLRLWRGAAGAMAVMMVLGLWSLMLPRGTAQETSPAGGRQTLAQRLAALEDKLQYLRVGVDALGSPELVITGANVRIVNGEDATSTANGLGNLIVGYNELRDLSGCDPEDPFCKNTRTGSHNVVVGAQNNFSKFGGLVGGFFNEISGNFSSVSGGRFNTASGHDSSVSGGTGNTASGQSSVVSGGASNMASGGGASVSGGQLNKAIGIFASVSGGQFNEAINNQSSVSGGRFNDASGEFSSVSGGNGNVASGQDSSVSGGTGNTASGQFSSVSGGWENTASGMASSVSGGEDGTAGGQFDWVGGDLFISDK